MKLRYICFLMFLLCLSACYDDLGNYHYKEINEIKILDGIDESYSAYTMVDTVRINPVVSFSQDSTEIGRIEYNWYLSTGGVTTGKVTKISDQRNLVYPVTLDRGTYILTFGIKDNVTGVEWRQDAYLYVTTLFTNGWLFLGEKEGYAALDMVSISSVGDTAIIYDLLKSSGLPALKGPRKMVSINRPDNASWPWTNGCFLLTDNGTYEMDRISLTSDVTTNIRKDIYDPMVSDDFAATDIIQSQAYYRFMIGDNNLYVNGSLASSGAFGNPVNKYDKYSDEYFRVFPEILWGMSSWGVFSGNQMVYDMDGKRFVKFNNRSANCEKLPDNEGEPFAWETGNDMIAIFNSKFMSAGSPTSYAVMKSPESKYYVYSFQPAVSAGPRKGNRHDITGLPGIGQATKFAFSSKYPYMLYVVGSKLHACELLTTGIIHKEFDGFGDDEITMLYFDNFKEGGKDYFYVATYNDAAGGTVQKYQLKDDPNDMIIEKIEGSRWDKLCKVTSMCWKWY